MSFLPRTQRTFVLLGLLAIPAVFGCSIPAQCVRPNICDAPRSSLEPIDFTRLEQRAPEVYLLGPGDIVGIYIEEVLGTKEIPPPVHFYEDAKIPPALGYPVPVRQDGTLPLPMVPPVQVSGLSLEQAEQLIRKTYTVDWKILQPDRLRIIVTLMKRRTYQVMVVREDTTTVGVNQKNAFLGVTQRGTCHAVELPAYENDVLHALAESGGLPGLDAENAVLVLRRLRTPDSGAHSGTPEDLFRQLQPPDAAASPSGPKEGHVLPAPASAESGILDAQTLQAARGMLENKDGFSLDSYENVVRIPLRTYGGTLPPGLTEEDVILHNGDVVFVKSRDAEVFYTGGLLKGGQHRIPRDYDLDVLGAIALAGGSINAPPGGSGGIFGHNSIGPIIPPTRVEIVRVTNGRQFTIRARVPRLMKNPRERILIQPNDLVTLEYTPAEFLMNATLSMLQFNYFINR